MCQFCWWAYLLIKLNDEVYEHRMELLLSNYKNESSASFEVKSLESTLHKRWLMIAGEGIVFGLLLIAGIYLTGKSFKKEFQLGNQQRNFLLSVTHEFKSPLAAIKLGLQTLDKHKLSYEQQHQILQKAIMESNRINELVENALTAAQLENRSLQLNKEELNFSELVAGVIELRQGIHYKKISFETAIQPDIYLKGDSLALQSAVINLVDNAEKYSPENSKVSVGLKEINNQVVFTVEDQGPGVPKGERLKIFEKFYRIGNEDTRSAKGTGLGLYIAQHVALLHKGRIVVKDNFPSGSIFEMVLKS